MSFVWQLAIAVCRIIFLRGSPERIYYTRRLFKVCIFAAIVLSALAQWFYFADHLVFVILRVFAELTLFMIMMVLLTARIPRFRLARMMLVLVLISLMTDSLLLILSPLFLSGMINSVVLPLVAYGVGALAIYGAANVMAWGINKPIIYGAGIMGLYVLGVLALNESFKHLYQIMASG